MQNRELTELLSQLESLSVECIAIENRQKAIIERIRGLNRQPTRSVEETAPEPPSDRTASIVTNQCVYEEFFMAILNVVILCLFSFSYPLVIICFASFSHFGIMCDFWLGLVTLLADRLLYSHSLSSMTLTIHIIVFECSRMLLELILLLGCLRIVCPW